MEYEGRFWKKSFYSGEIDGPKEFIVEARSLKEALKKAIALMFQVEVCLFASVIEKSELLVEGQWKEFGPEGFKQLQNENLPKTK